MGKKFNEVWIYFNRNFANIYSDNEVKKNPCPGEKTGIEYQKKSIKNKSAGMLFLMQMISYFCHCFLKKTKPHKYLAMNWKIFTPKVMVVAGIILFAAIMRLLPHYPNFTPIAAIALFGGAHLGKRFLAFFIPLFALFISDLILGFHGFMLPVYISFMLVVLLGQLMKNNVRIVPVAGAAVASATVFFLVTNFAVWLTTPYYGPGFNGLMACYTAALPFFHTSMLGDLFYSAVFFGGFYLVKLRFPLLQTA